MATRLERCIIEDLKIAGKYTTPQMEARNKGLIQYNTGIPCKHGHTSNRNTKTNRCMQCDSIASAKPDHKLKMKCDKYGITVEHYKSMFTCQQGKCALCLNEFDQSLVVDHCHATGEVRALLCQQCNSMLGFAKDNPETLKAGAKYLELFTSNPQ